MSNAERRKEAIERFKLWQERSDDIDVVTKVARQAWNDSERGEPEFHARLEYEGAKAKQEYVSGELLAAAYSIVLLDQEGGFDGE